MKIELGIYGKVIFWCITLFIFLYEIYQILKGRASDNWRAHTAKVTDVRIDTRVNDGVEESKPSIKYHYSYMGSSYKGSKIKYGDLWSNNYSNASKMLSGIVKGSNITIYVNPKRPNQSVLYRGYQGHVVWFIGCMAVFVFLAVQS
ncbi:DUF3592 domain-containing protein [Sessilibacter corallicola]|uniref:DUF3592 domain-containing protein n=1 Tax=Sessilibacter corallicola TaxID=2904075 RepID=UPI003312F90D